MLWHLWIGLFSDSCSLGLVCNQYWGILCLQFNLWHRLPQLPVTAQSLLGHSALPGHAKILAYGPPYQRLGTDAQVFWNVWLNMYLSISNDRLSMYLSEWGWFVFCLVRLIIRSIQATLAPSDVTRALLAKKRASKVAEREDYGVSWSRNTSASSIFRISADHHSANRNSHVNALTEIAWMRVIGLGLRAVKNANEKKNTVGSENYHTQIVRARC